MLVNNIQDLLDAEATLKNSGKDATSVVIRIRELRGDKAPVCFGEDDCSTEILSRCPWRMDCG